MHNDEIQQLKMTGIRHPCLELQEDVNYIPNDVEFNQGKSVVRLILYTHLLHLYITIFHVICFHIYVSKVSIYFRYHNNSYNNRT